MLIGTCGHGCDVLLCGLMTVADDVPTRLVAVVRGRVQGVGFRFWTRSRALELGLCGWARNLADGRVEVVAEGARTRCVELLGVLRGPGVPGRVDAVVERYEPAHGDVEGFVTG
jgi:acylphosphatase